MPRHRSLGVMIDVCLGIYLQIDKHTAGPPVDTIDATPPPKPIVTKVPIERPSSDAPLQKLTPQVLSSLTKSLELLRKEGSCTSGVSENDANIGVVVREKQRNLRRSSINQVVPLEAAAINATVVAPTTSRCRFDWFQMSGNITLSVYAKNIIPESADVRCNGVFLNVSLVYDGGRALFQRSFNLYGVDPGPLLQHFFCKISSEFPDLLNSLTPPVRPALPMEMLVVINPSVSKLTLTATKAEVVMQKAEAYSWPTLEVTSSKAKGSEESEDTDEQ
ncbi:hypothetical protein ACTXT7_009750 [Hymenolepis weldensis]